MNNTDTDVVNFIQLNEFIYIILLVLAFAVIIKLISIHEPFTRMNRMEEYNNWRNGEIT